MRIASPQVLENLQTEYKTSLDSQRKQILICAGTGCVAGGSLKIYHRLHELLEERGLHVALKLEKDRTTKASA